MSDTQRSLVLLGDRYTNLLQQLGSLQSEWLSFPSMETNALVVDTRNINVGAFFLITHATSSLSSRFLLASGQDSSLTTGQTTAETLSKFFLGVLDTSRTTQRASSLTTNAGLYKARKFESSDATAFTNIDVLRAIGRPASLSHSIEYLRKLFRPTFGPLLADRLQQLASLYREETEGREQLSNVSVNNLVSFLEINPAIRRPNIAASPVGNIIAQWRDTKGSLFSAHFLEDGTVKYFSIRSNPKHPDKLARTSGETTSDALFEMANLRSLDWVINER